jgi:hypothetical protein
MAPEWNVKDFLQNPSIKALYKLYDSIIMSNLNRNDSQLLYICSKAQQA